MKNRNDELYAQLQTLLVFMFQYNGEYPLFLSSQAQLLSSIQLSPDDLSAPGSLLLPSPSATSGGSSSGGDFVQDYMPLFSDPPSNQTLSTHDPLTQCLPAQDLTTPPPPPSSLDGVLNEAHSVSSPSVTSNAAAGSDYAPQLPQLAPMPPTLVQQKQHPQTFALPQPFQPVSANKNRTVKRIAPANTLPASHLILTGVMFCAFIDFYYSYSAL